MNGPGDKLKAFMSKFIKPKSTQAYNYVQGAVSGEGDLKQGRSTRRAMKNLKKQGLTGDPYADEVKMYGPQKDPLNPEVVSHEKQRRK